MSPWVYLRKVPVSISKPSNHVIVVNFEEGVLKAFPGSSSAISIAPLYEWHSFANITIPDKDGFRLVISRAGDWTSSVIDNPPTHFWVRGIPTAGVANMETLFHKILYVATGSGIGPILPHLLQKRVPSRLLWSTRTPESTYGRDLVEEITAASPDAVIHDTTLLGKPDMVQKSYQLFTESGAEAVIVISNQKLTRKVVYGMESRGIPAFGAIWDS
ncbi:Ferredoxin-NADP reductase [Gracilaria domingensis]|nr:Ferredoxin-NADP reductase [Gracilaria domingensis]